MTWKQVLKNEDKPNRESIYRKYGNEVPNEREIWVRVKELHLQADDLKAEIKDLDKNIREAKDAKDEDLARKLGWQLADALEDLGDILALIDKFRIKLRPDTDTQYWLRRVRNQTTHQR